MELKNKTCIPCSGAVPPLPLNEIHKFKELIDHEWELTHDSTRLFRNIPFKNFLDPMKLAHQIGELAEREWHHPELHVGFGHLGVEIWTHKINGLVESDFIFAAKVDALYKSFKA